MSTTNSSIALSSLHPGHNHGQSGPAHPIQLRRQHSSPQVRHSTPTTSAHQPGLASINRHSRGRCRSPRLSRSHQIMELEAADRPPGVATESVAPSTHAIRPGLASKQAMPVRSRSPAPHISPGQRLKRCFDLLPEEPIFGFRAPVAPQWKSRGARRGVPNGPRQLFCVIPPRSLSIDTLALTRCVARARFPSSDVLIGHIDHPDDPNFRRRQPN